MPEFTGQPGSIFQVALPKTKGAKHAAGPGSAGAVFVTGDREIDEMLGGLEKNVQRQIARVELRKVAKEIILPEAQNRVPVDTGQLESVLKVRAIKRSRTNFGVEVSTAEGLFQGEEYYGGFIEFGTKHMDEQPFLRPAGYGNEPRIRKKVIQGIRTALKAAAKGKQA